MPHGLEIDIRQVREFNARLGKDTNLFLKTFDGIDEWILHTPKLQSLHNQHNHAASLLAEVRH